MTMTDTDRLDAVISDGNPHSSYSLYRKVYGRNCYGASLTRRMADLRERGMNIITVKSKKNRKKCWYMRLPHWNPRFICGISKTFSRNFSGFTYRIQQWDKRTPANN